ncbi:hypothetical protein DFH11DRAFT_1730085 [Phellopilus nigrolimitatus]|nr:hypothetical protein DFH11DRAFT_1730085 [Phellopilus nigrolimitatus]
MSPPPTRMAAQLPSLLFSRAITPRTSSFRALHARTFLPSHNCRKTRVKRKGISQGVDHLPVSERESEQESEPDSESKSESFEPDVLTAHHAGRPVLLPASAVLRLRKPRHEHTGEPSAAACPPVTRVHARTSAEALNESNKQARAPWPANPNLAGRPVGTAGTAGPHTAGLAVYPMSTRPLVQTEGARQLTSLRPLLRSPTRPSAPPSRRASIAAFLSAHGWLRASRFAGYSRALPRHHRLEPALIKRAPSMIPGLCVRTNRTARPVEIPTPYQRHAPSPTFPGAKHAHPPGLNTHIRPWPRNQRAVSQLVDCTNTRGETQAPLTPRAPPPARAPQAAPAVPGGGAGAQSHSQRSAIGRRTPVPVPN